MHIRIILKFFEKYKCSGIDFFLQSSRYISNEQSRLKTTGLYDDLLLPGGLQAEIGSPEETHRTPEMVFPLCTQETEQLGWERG